MGANPSTITKTRLLFGDDRETGHLIEYCSKLDLKERVQSLIR